MQRSVYNLKSNKIDNVLGWIIIVTLSLVLLFCILWVFPSGDKANYKRYKSCESKINKEFQQIISKTEENSKIYYSNQISKRQMISHLNKAAKDLTKLYDSFKWKRGDIVTKELFAIKKNVIINYAQIYENKAESLENGTMFDETEESEYISILMNEYNLKDRFQKERYNISF